MRQCPGKKKGKTLQKRPDCPEYLEYPEHLECLERLEQEKQLEKEREQLSGRRLFLRRSALTYIRP